jgi:hypothetical protein
MKATEAARIPGLLAARRPPVIYEEVTIDGVRMLVIIGTDVDTVIRFSRGESADMPQICSYPEVAESAVYADQRLSRQRASGRKILQAKERTGHAIGNLRMQGLQARSGMRNPSLAACHRNLLVPLRRR